MSTEIASIARIDADEQTDRRLDLHARFLQAGVADPTLLVGIPKDVMLFLLPDDDPAFVEREVALAATAARRGKDVYLRHVRLADLPELSPPTGPQPGDRRATYDPATGGVLSNQILGPDGHWHETDLPLPGPRDDDDPWFAFR